jgi:hypothetical protein
MRVSPVCTNRTSVLFTLHAEQEDFSVTLKATEPVLPAVAAGRTVDYTWSSEAAYGLSRRGSDPTGKYMPLFRLKQPRPKFWEWPFLHR